jgi:hypothetical protein
MDQIFKPSVIWRFCEISISSRHAQRDLVDQELSEVLVWMKNRTLPTPTAC